MEVDNPTDLEPLEFLNRAAETNGEFIRVEVTLHPYPAGSNTESDLTHNRWIVDGIGEHVHPKQEEIFKIRTGELRVVLDGTQHTLTPGDEISLPPNTPHSHWNPTDRPARVLVEHRPAQKSDALLETLYTLAQTGKTDERGVPNFLQSMVLQHAYADHAYSTDQPIIAQKLLATILAPIGRLTGYKSTYSIDEIHETR